MFAAMVGLFGLLLAMPVIVWATRTQSPSTRVQRAFAFDPDTDWSELSAIAPAPGGGWFLAGHVKRRSDGSDHYALARLTSSGELDRTALQDGRALTRVAPGYHQTSGVTGLKDGGALILGFGEWSSGGDDRYHAVIVRVRTDGTPDERFGENGAVVIRGLPGRDNYRAAAAARILPDGKILVAGEDARGPFLARLLPDGRLDPRFGVDGIAHPIRGGRQFSVTDLLLAGRGRAVIAGSLVTSGRLGNDTRNFDFAAIRVDRRGRLDSSFGRDGLVTLTAGREPKGWDEDYDFVRAARWVGRRLVLAGTVDHERLYVIRLRSDGRLDRRFGRGGRWRGPRGRSLLIATTVDARGGSWFARATSDDTRTTVRRVTTGGKSDPRVGARGVLSFNVSRGTDWVRQAAASGTGRLVLAYAGRRVRTVLLNPMRGRTARTP